MHIPAEASLDTPGNGTNSSPALESLIHRANEDKLFPGPGQGNVQYPHFLRLILLCHAQGNRLTGKGRIAHGFFKVRAPRPQPQLTVHEQRSIQILQIELLADICQHHHRKLRPLLS